MEVLVGPTFGIKVSSSSAFARESSSLEKMNGVDPAEEMRTGLGIVGGGLTLPPEDLSESSSSIGTPGDTDEEEDEEDEVDSSKCDGGEKFEGKLNRGFGSLGSLEDALPVKRGLSSHFSGKSKSFANLSEMSSTSSTVKDVEKQENPLNKKRRVLIASRRMRKSFYSWSNPKSMPLLPVNEEEDDPDPDPEPEPENDDPSSSSSSDEKDQREQGKKYQFRLQKYHERRLGSLKFQTCYSLPDLQEQDDEPS